MHRILIIFFSFLFFIPFTLYSQGYRVEFNTFKYSDFEEIRDFRFPDIIQGQNNFIWLTNRDGIYRFDGSDFKLYSREEIGVNDLEYLTITEDKHGKIWILSGSDKIQNNITVWKNLTITILDTDRDDFQTFDEVFGEIAPFEVEDVSGVYHKDRELWICTIKGEVYSYDGKFTKKYSNGGKHNLLWVYPSMDGNFWIKEKNTFFKVSGLTGEILKTNTANLKYYFDSEEFHYNRYFFKWKSTFSNLLIYLLEKNITIIDLLKKYQIPNNDIKSITFDAQKRLWVWTENNICVYDEKQGKILNLSNYIKFTDSKVAAKADIFFDKNNHTWCSFNREIIVLELKKTYFRSFFSETKMGVRAIVEFNRDSILVGARGILKVPKKGKGYDVLIPSDTLLATYGIAKKENDYFIGVHGTSFGWLDFDMSPYKIQKIIAKPGQVLLTPFVSSQGKVWFGMPKEGLSYWDENLKEVVLYLRLNGFKIIRDTHIRSFYENEEGIWITTSNGIFLLDEKKGIIAYYKDFPDNFINHIYEDKNGIFWLSSKRMGLIRWDRNAKDQTFTTYPQLEKREIYAAIEDNYNRLWLPSANGLIRFEKKTENINIFYKEDGLPSNEFNHLAFLQTRDGMIYLGGMRGMIAFDPQDFLDDFTTSTKIAVVDLKIHNQKTGKLEDFTQGFNQSKKIIIQPFQKSFVLKLSTFDFVKSLNKFAFKLEGHDTDWNFFDGNILRINHLEYGNHTLKVKALAGLGKWTEDLSIPIEIIRPFYLKTWFKVALPAFIGLVLFFMIGYRISRLEKQELLLKNEVERQTKEIRAQSAELEKANEVKDRLMAVIGHELRGAFMSFYQMPENLAYLIKKEQFDRAIQVGHLINDGLFHINHLLNNLLDWGVMQAGRGTVIPENIAIKEKLEENIEILKNKAAAKEIKLSLLVKREASVFMDETSFIVIMNNLVFNAIKFTEAGGEIIIQSFTQGEATVVEVKDTGIGMTQEQIDNLFSTTKAFQTSRGTQNEKGTGLGINLCIQLAKINNGTLTFESKKRKGTSAKLIVSSKNI